MQNLGSNTVLSLAFVQYSLFKNASMLAKYVIFLFQVLSIHTILTMKTVALVAGLGLDGTEAFRLVFVDGVISESLSKVDGLSEGAYVGSICNIPAEDAGGALSQALEHLGKPVAGTQDDLFTFLNGLGV
jgi:hypothetical protein